MKPYRMEELRTLSDEELSRRERELREALFKMRMQLAIGQYTKVADVSVTRRNLARVLTVARERQGGFRRLLSRAHRKKLRLKKARLMAAEARR